MSTSDDKPSDKPSLHPKDSSRIIKKCQWCLKDEKAGGEKFKSCARCKAVIYCGRECQVAHWKLHKNTCKTIAESWEKLSENPEDFKLVREFKEWHVKYRHEIGHAAICGLNLGDEPAELDTMMFFLDLEDPDGFASEVAALPYAQKYRIKMGMGTTLGNAQRILGEESKPLFENLRKTHEFTKTKQSWLGTLGVVIRYNGIVDFTLVRVPPLRMLRSRIYMWDWRSNPIMHLGAALKNGTRIPDPLKSAVELAVGDENGIHPIPEKRPFEYDNTVIIGGNVKK